MNPKSLVIKPCHRKHKIWYKKARYKCMHGGRCSTKTWGAAEGVVYYTSKYKTRITCAREIKDRIDSSTRKVVVDTIFRLGLEDEYDITYKQITHKYTGSEITFIGLNPDDKESLKGLEGVNILWIDEAENVSEETMRIITPTIRGGKNSQIWLTWNPADIASWVSKTFMQGKLPRNTLVETLNYTEVLHVIPEVLIQEAEDLKESDYDAYCHIWLGEYRLENHNSLFNAMRLNECYDRKEPEVIDKLANIILSIDCSGTGKDDNVFIVRQGMQILDYHEVKIVNGAQRIALARALINKWRCNYTVIDMGGGFGSSLYEGLAEIYKHTIIQFMSGFKANNIVYGNARAECYDLLSDWVNDGGSLGHIKQKAKDRLLLEMTGIKYQIKLGGKKYIIPKKELEDSPDAADALMMSFYCENGLDVEATKQAQEQF